MLARLFVALQYLVPRYWLTSVVYRIARARNVGLKDLLITRFVRLYKVDTGDVKLAIPADFATFNDFFIRELEDGARPIDPDLNSLVSPVDGTVSQAGTLRKDMVLQAKGREYSLDDLLATDLEEARAFDGGAFATLYLAPYNYHRVHAPLPGTLVAARYVPGDLFSVNAATATWLDGVFRRNERLILHFDTGYGPATVILVGALNVGSITTPWSGEIRPRKTGAVETVDISGATRAIAKGDLLGWFNMGSTVILLLPKGTCNWHDTLGPGSTVVMGRPIATLANSRG